MTTKKMIRMAVLAAFGVILMYFIAFPFPIFPGFLTYDPGDIPGIIATFAMGPWAGVLVQFLKCLMGYLVGASRAAFIGMMANFVAGGTMVLVAGLIYRYRKTKRMAILSLGVSTAIASLVMAIADYYVFFPLWGVSLAEAKPLLLSAVIPFNMLKFGISSVVTFLIYKKIKGFFEMEGLKGRREIAGTKDLW